MWKPPSDADLAYVMVRYTIGRAPPKGPLGGYVGYVGNAGSVILKGLSLGRAASVSVYTVDAAGNIGDPISKTISPRRKGR